ncbi:TIGR01458 family HAD-type hydrolase [Aliiruegeria lutimaris]|uniref:Haloacid dehalogenase-like hydrolase domain-containing protein 2 n=1 Tax=Aliiruegeria lutimaris TaxID=571298 RepID=A0A1G9PD89_9RHOB|nr:TIGR01458 family HAD-type hydrolase [Aliiruegeria lutimaris]SDL96822.1 HAD-superfamily subfamily IIA hydrolase, TIGR01458 [Aliiruegeria lutimaris]
MIGGVLLDISGVLYQGDVAIPGAVEAVRRLRNAGLPIRFLTNSTRRPKRDILTKLQSLGFDVDGNEVLTPAAAACAWLEANGYVPHLLVHPDLEEDFAACRTVGPVAVVVGDAGLYFTYERLNEAFREIESGAPFLALATNRVFRDADGMLSLDAGAFVRALEYSSGKDALVLGKPSVAFFRSGAEGMGSDPADIAMVGDDAESDVAGAISAGIGMGILVRTGKYRDGDETRFNPEPTHVARDIVEAVDAIVANTG